jgi:hypothetical protein
MFRSVSEHFANLRHVKRRNTCVRTWMHYFEVPKLWSNHSTRLEPNQCLGVFRSISLTFGHVKRCKTGISGLNAPFRGAKVVKHPFYSIGRKMIYGSVLEHFANHWQVKDAKLVFEPECTISGYQSCEACILLHWTKNYVGSVSEHFTNLRHIKWCKLVFRAYYFSVLKLWSIHSTPLEPKWCLGVFWSISLTFGTYKLHNLYSRLNALFRNQSCEALILLHWTRFDVWECFRAFRK